MGEWSRGVQTLGTCNCAVDIKYVVHTGWFAVEQVIDLQTVREGELYYIRIRRDTTKGAASVASRIFT